MKRSSIVFSSSSPCSPSSSSSSSPSSSVEFQNPDQTEEGGQDSNNNNNNNNTKRPRNSSENENAKKKSQKRRGRTLTSAAAINGGRRSSIYRGVTRHRWTGRFEAHLWDKSSWNNLQNKKGRQVYLGAYDNEEDAARTYDLAALKYWGRSTTLNFPLETYSKDLEEMEKATKEEYLASLRRQSSGFSRGVSKYRGVARHHHNGRWEARIGRVLGNKYLYLGTYSTQEEAAMAYDVAAIQYRGVNAVTNFDISNYMDKINNKTTQNSDESQNQQQQEQTLIITVTSSSSSHQQEQQQQQQVHHPHHSFDSQNLHNHNDHQEQPQQIEPQNPQIQSSPIAPVDPPLATTNEPEFLPWIFMDDDAFSQFQVPDLPVADLLHMFNDGGGGSGGGGRLDDDAVDFLFRTSTEEVEFNMEEILNSPTYPDLVIEDSAMAMAVCDDDDNDDDFGPEKLLCSATSPSSSSPNSSISSYV